MKKGKNDAINFKIISPVEMSKISGGQWYVVYIDGVKKTIWVPD
jgi:hypothetical protein